MSSQPIIIVMRKIQSWAFLQRYISEQVIRVRSV